MAPAGPELDGFERDVAALTGWPGAVALSSGTAALHLALLVSGVQPGDDVLVSTLTFAASANAVVHCGANPVFVDSERTSWNMDPELLAEALTAAGDRGRLPAAVVVVDLYGQCADYDAIAALCDDHGVALVEDAAEALGATHGGRPAGTLGDIGVFSFNGNKIATTSGGGMVVTPDPAVADRVRHLATQAREPVPHFEHVEVGFNYRLSNLLAAIGRAQLARLPEMIDRRLAIHDRYRGHLADVPGISVHADRPVGALERMADVHRARRAGATRCRDRPAGGTRHREPAAVEADAPATGVPRPSGVHERRQRRALPARPLPAERLSADRRPGRHHRRARPRRCRPRRRVSRRGRARQASRRARSQPSRRMPAGRLAAEGVVVVGDGHGVAPEPVEVGRAGDG